MSKRKIESITVHYADGDRSFETIRGEGSLLRVDTAVGPRKSPQPVRYYSITIQPTPEEKKPDV